jgi:hypothetical protein
VIDNLKQGQMLFAYYPDKDWLAHSPFLKCNTRATMVASTGGGGAMEKANSARSR